MGMKADGVDTCIHCQKELAIMERNRSECWDCREKQAVESYCDSFSEDEVQNIMHDER